MDLIHRQEGLRGPSIWSPNSSAKSRELLQGCLSTAAVLTSSLTSACTFRGRPAFYRFYRCSISYLKETLLQSSKLTASE